MPSILNPYLNFRGTAREAMDFYQSVFGGEVQRSTFADYQMAQDPADNDLVMHSQLTSPGGFTLMAADVPDRSGRYVRTSNRACRLAAAAAGSPHQARHTEYWVMQAAMFAWFFGSLLTQP